MSEVIFRTDQEDVSAEFLENDTAEKILENLPIESKVKTWGDEIYFDTGIDAPSKDATLDVSVGDIAYWPEGKCLCIFFGPTAISKTEKPVPASEVVIIGKTSAKPEFLRKIKSGTKIRVEKG
ncbi:hypothetical protein AUJ66_02185 [Candidatus Desantisbacteria bacterium CG1_02_38_46]|uniref:Cyclophilin TM1367-like domain-containing protein n=3 Tax=unclassified Candidatus Desantisiibacteriota TaxID=3106372 RepID=A0A2H9P9Y7_9BACT|nr:MAG: hypothetical protein AUJ66_02185 [Candidatus Desantisbacteria bacterium CG1_02_38_46]PIU51523.1 MAG: hypothetical protein COS91_03980 [Candidatus Desantisbacteria bacterium CG07_land_8_20_14_0_80_39_15]PIZ15081.1 MAG: hypothetical protein COY51_06335 [Candidatus Desantisbacteria bacterium CG_4_10_14_0_8_um_filter_39_17]